MRLITLKLSIALLLAVSFSSVILGLQGVSPPISRAFDFTVTKFTDTNDGSCDADCSLREAIIGANASVTDDTITLGAGIYTLSITGTGENLAAIGDLDIDSSHALTITGLGPAQTIIDANGIDRVFHILNGTVVISGVTVRGGFAEGWLNGFGGGIHNADQLHLQNIIVVENTADYDGGGIYNNLGNLTITYSDFFNNSAKNGGGIANNETNSSLIVMHSDIHSNTSEFSGGGIDNSGSLTMTYSNIYGNIANFTGGGGIENNGSMTIAYGNIYSNTASYGGGIYNYKGRMTLTQSNIYNNSGGGIHSNQGDQTIESNSIYSNTYPTGGGISLNDSNLIMSDSRIYSNTATSGGGISISNDSTIFITESKIYNNFATILRGGGIINHGDLTITLTDIYSNSAVDGGGISNLDGMLNIAQSNIFSNAASNNGGGIESTGDLTVTQSNIYSNVSDKYGGGIVGDGSMAVIQSSFFDNFALGGGGISNHSGILAITKSRVYRNVTGGYGGGGIRNDGTLAVLQSSIYSNSAILLKGGGIYNRQGELTVIQSSILDNFAPVGGGIYNYGTTSITNSTVSGNQANTGGGLYGNYDLIEGGGPLSLVNSTVVLNQGGGLYSVSPININLQNTLLADNTGDNCTGTGTLVSRGHNLADDNTCNLSATGDQPNTDPLLQPLADNGGPTVGVENAPLPTHAIPPNSLAVDAADNTACPTADQRGIVRPQGPGCDIGAFEVAPGPALSIRKIAPSFVIPGDPITYTLTVTNSGTISAATNVIISDTLPSGANLVNILDGGTLNGDVIQWVTSSLSPGNAFVARFVITATENISNEIYLATADENISASGGVAVVTIVSEMNNTYLPIIVKDN